MADPKSSTPAKSAEGPKKYRLTERFYRLGVMHQPGEIITLEAGQKPGRTWVELAEGDAPKVMVPVKPDAGRASDKDI